MKNTEINLDLEALIKQMGDELRSGKPLTGAGGVFTPLIKKVIESSLEGEMDAHLQKTDKASKNRRNGRSRKNVLSSSGGLEIFSPRDRDGSFQP